MKRFMFSATLAVAAIVMVLSAARAAAAEERPFQASVETTFLGWDADGNLVYSGTATLPHWGWTKHLARVAIQNKNKATGTITVYFGNGDMVNIEFEQVWDGIWVGDYWVTGGTGKFADAAGGGTITADAREAGKVVLTYEGTLSY